MNVQQSGVAGSAAAQETWSAAAGAEGAPAAGNSTDRLANKEVFLQLLVAQIRHQNPLNPTEGTEFVAQLAQFTQLELSLGIRKDLEQIREALSAAPQAEAAPAASGGDAKL